MKKQNGITLIGLVITIIVLLILAGVSISMVIGENGVLKQSDIAVEETRRATAKEEVELAWASVDAEYWNDWANNSNLKKEDYYTTDNLNKYLEGKGKFQGITSNEDGTYIVRYESASDNMIYTIKVDTIGKASIIEGSVHVSQQPGLYDANGNLIKNWSTLLADGDIIVTNGELVAGGKEADGYCGSGHVFTLSGKLVIDSSVTSIGRSAFGCSICPAGQASLIEEVIIPDSVTTIGYGAFGGCSKLKSITIGNGVTTLDSIFGMSSSGLETITIGKNVTEMNGGQVNSSSGNYMEPFFSMCSKLQSINVDAGNQSYSSVDGVLFNKSKTELIEYPNAKTDTSYSIPNTVTKVWEYAFSGAKNITELNIPASMISVGNYAFSSMTGLKNINFPSTISSIGIRAFSGAGFEFLSIPGTIKTIGQSAFTSCNDLETITFEEGVQTINKWVLYGCESLQTINIPMSASYIGNGIASYCESLTTINVNANNNYYCSENGILYNKNKTKMIQYPCGKPDTTFTIPSHVTTIGERAMLGTEYIQKLIIPSTVTKIEASACSYGRVLRYIYFEHTTSFPTCGNSCFWQGPSGTYKYTFYFKNSTMRNKLTTSHYWSSYGTKSTNYSW